MNINSLEFIKILRHVAILEIKLEKIENILKQARAYEYKYDEFTPSAYGFFSKIEEIIRE